MNTHALRLHPEPFNEIAIGSKTMELRLFDEKRQLIKVGDTLVFTSRADPSKTIRTKVSKLVYSETFHSLLAENEVVEVSGPNVEWVEEQLNRFYSLEEQHKFGVVGIEFTLMV